MVDNEGTPDGPSEEKEDGNNREDTMTRREGEEGGGEGRGGRRAMLRSNLSSECEDVFVSHVGTSRTHI